MDPDENSRYHERGAVESGPPTQVLQPIPGLANTYARQTIAISGEELVPQQPELPSAALGQPQQDAPP